LLLRLPFSIVPYIIVYVFVVNVPISTVKKKSSELQFWMGNYWKIFETKVVEVAKVVDESLWKDSINAVISTRLTV